MAHHGWPHVAERHLSARRYPPSQDADAAVTRRNLALAGERGAVPHPGADTASTSTERPGVPDVDITISLADIRTGSFAASAASPPRFKEHKRMRVWILAGFIVTLMGSSVACGPETKYCLDRHESCAQAKADDDRVAAENAANAAAAAAAAAADAGGAVIIGTGGGSGN
jgi:hypothetical protein